VAPDDDVRVRILEIDSDRRRLSLSIKRVEGQILPRREITGLTEAEDGGVGDLDSMPELGLSEDVFAEGAPAPEPSSLVTETDEALAETAGDGVAPVSDETLSPDEAPAAPDASVEESTAASPDDPDDPDDT
jgi:small subunit ribosomal protein S1